MAAMPSVTHAAKPGWHVIWRRGGLGRREPDHDKSRDERDDKAVDDLDTSLNQGELRRHLPRDRRPPLLDVETMNRFYHGIPLAHGR